MISYTLSQLQLWPLCPTLFHKYYYFVLYVCVVCTCYVGVCTCVCTCGVWSSISAVFLQHSPSYILRLITRCSKNSSVWLVWVANGPFLFPDIAPLPKAGVSLLHSAGVLESGLHACAATSYQRSHLPSPYFSILVII